jgi:uncharacterized protein (DUF1778 family)
MPTPTAKKAVVILRVTAKEKKLLQKAALLAKRKVADFIRFHALTAAEAAVAEQGLSTPES